MFMVNKISMDFRAPILSLLSHRFNLVETRTHAGKFHLREHRTSRIVLETYLFPYSPELESMRLVCLPLAVAILMKPAASSVNWFTLPTANRLTLSRKDAVLPTRAWVCIIIWLWMLRKEVYSNSLLKHVVTSTTPVWVSHDLIQGR